MRSFQVMNYGRRTPLKRHHSGPSMSDSFSSQSLFSRQSSVSSSSHEQNRDVQSSNDSNILFKHRRNTLFPNTDLSTRRPSFQQLDIIEPIKTKTNLRNFYIFFILLFLFLFLSLVYSFIRMIKNPA